MLDYMRNYNCQKAMEEMKMMKVITKLVSIKDEKFVLIKDTDKNYGDYYGTIPYSELDEKGRMTRALNGFEMCIAKTIAKALETREDMMNIKGMSMIEVAAYFATKVTA